MSFDLYCYSSCNEKLRKVSCFQKHGTAFYVLHHILGLEKRSKYKRTLSFQKMCLNLINMRYLVEMYHVVYMESKQTEIIEVLKKVGNEDFARRLKTKCANWDLFEFHAGKLE